MQKSTSRFESELSENESKMLLWLPNSSLRDILNKKSVQGDFMEKMIFSSYEIANSIKDTLRDGGHFPLMVTGTSMQPFLKNGEDVVWLRACTPSDIKKGAILLFERADGSFILHRVNKILPDGKLMMNGDAHQWLEKIRPEQVVAVVNEIEKNGKKISCGSPGYRLKVFAWGLLRPVRHYVVRIIKIFRR